jgi:hypothetical protein
MNPGPILIMINTFPTLTRVLLFSSLIKSENTKTYLLSCIYNQNPSPTLNNGNTQIPNTPSYSIDDDPLCDIVVSNIWEDESDLVELDNPLCSLNDLYLCGGSVHNYDVEFTFDA